MYNSQHTPNPSLPTKLMRALSFILTTPSLVGPVAITGCILLLSPTITLAAPESNDNREGGSLVKDFQRLNQEFNNALQSAEQLSENTRAAGGKEALNAAHEALVEGDDVKVAEIFAEEMAAGRGPNYWQKQRAEFSSKENEFFSLYEELRAGWREARRSSAAGDDRSASSMLDELDKQMATDRSSKTSSRLRAALANAKKQRDEKFKKLLDAREIERIEKAAHKECFAVLGVFRRNEPDSTEWDFTQAAQFHKKKSGLYVAELALKAKEGMLWKYTVIAK